jgi:hypothetical protein
MVVDSVLPLAKELCKLLGLPAVVFVFSWLGREASLCGYCEKLIRTHACVASYSVVMRSKRDKNIAVKYLSYCTCFVGVQGAV